METDFFDFLESVDPYEYLSNYNKVRIAALIFDS